MWSFLKTWWAGIIGQDLRVPTARDRAGDSAGASFAEPEDGVSADTEPGAPNWWDGDPSTSETSASAEMVDSALLDQLTHVLDDRNIELPRLPQTARLALDALGSADVKYPKLAALVGQDPAIATEVLKVANSVLHRGVQEVRDLESAFVRLGRRTIRSVILGVSLKGLVIRTGGAQRTVGEELWRNSMASAILMRELAEFGTLPPEEAFLLGLLHDLGALVVVKVVHDFQQCHGRGVNRQVFERLCAQWHEHVGMRMAENWNLPDPLPALIGSHHRMPAPDDPHRRDRLLLQLVDGACVLLGFSPGPKRGLLTLPAAHDLGWTSRPNIAERLRPLPTMIETAVGRAGGGESQQT